MTSDRELGRALRSLGTAEHGPGFWDDLTTRLDGGGAGAALARRRRFCRRALIVAGTVTGAAAVVAGGMALSPAADREGQLVVGSGRVPAVVGATTTTVARHTEPLVTTASPTTVALPTTTFAPPPEPATTTTAPTTTTVVLPGPLRPEPAVVVETWLDAIAMGENDEAWSLMGEQSQSTMEAADIGELGERYRAWAPTSDHVYGTTELQSDERGRIDVVTVVQNGLVERSVIAIPTLSTEEGTVVEPYAVTTSAIEVTWPGEGKTFTDGDSFQAFTPAGATAIFAVDGSNPVTAEPCEATDGDRQLCSLAPDTEIAPGQHTLTVAYIDAAGRVGADAISFVR